MAGSFELKRGTSGQYFFNLRAGNGQVILTSESYTTRASAHIGITSVRKHAANDANFERKTSTRGEPFFILKAVNGQTIGQSEMYSSTAAMEFGIESIKNTAPGAVVVDLTA